MAVASICGQRLSVPRSYITRFALRRRPETPNVVSPRSNPWAVPVSGQYVTETGSPAMRSLTISWWTRMYWGYARASPPRSTPKTGSSSGMSASSADENCGSSMAGIPSFGTPPETTFSRRVAGS